MPDDTTIEQTRTFLGAARKIARAEFQPLIDDDANAVVNLARLMFEISQTNTSKGA